MWADVDATALRGKALARVAGWQLFLALLLFVPAGSLRFWEAWVYWSVFLFFVLFGTLYFLSRDPALLESRLRVGPAAEPEQSQKILRVLIIVLGCAIWVVPGIEWRLRAPILPGPLVLLANGIVVAGLAITFLAAHENSYASSAVEVRAGQCVVSTGPYRIVRHPMYAGGVLTFLATPPALGSLSALLFALPLCALLVARLLDEERFLLRNLAGYGEYCARVRDRLIPRVW